MDVDDMRIKIRNGDYEGHDNTTLAQLAEAWKLQKDDVRAVTLYGYEQVLKPILRDHGQVRSGRSTGP